LPSSSVSGSAEYISNRVLLAYQLGWLSTETRSKLDGDLPLAALADRRVRGEFKTWPDGFAATPRKAYFAWVVLARIMSFANDRGMITTNPCEKGGRLYAADRTDKVWGEQEIGALLSVASQEIKLARVPAQWTGQRQPIWRRLGNGRFAETGWWR
jgi:hypothetical protein